MRPDGLREIPPHQWPVNMQHEVANIEKKFNNVILAKDRKGLYVIVPGSIKK